MILTIVLTIMIMISLKRRVGHSRGAIECYEEALVHYPAYANAYSDSGPYTEL